MSEIYDGFSELINGIEFLQESLTVDWHKFPNDENLEINSNLLGLKDRLYNIVKNNHLMNFLLWHSEDIARRTDVSSDIIADCKHKIDSYNQKRTNYYEQMDELFKEILFPYLPDAATDIQNTESLGMAIDRLSILSLKIYHMKEQIHRFDVLPEHINSANKKLKILSEQHKNLAESIKYLISEYLSGAKIPKVFYQIKMYNDPNLNPQLYGDKNE